METLSIPACRCTLLLLSIKLNYVGLCVAAQTQLDGTIKPSFRNLPCFKFRVPSWYVSPSIAQPVFVPGRKWDAHKDGQGMSLFENHRNFLLTPYPLEIGVI